MATWTIEYDLKILLLLSLHKIRSLDFPINLKTTAPLQEGHILYCSEEIACFEDSLSLCKRPAILLLLVGLGDFIKKTRKLCIYSGLEKKVNLIFLLFHKQVLYGTWVRGIAFYVPVYFKKNF